MLCGNIDKIIDISYFPHYSCRMAWNMGVRSFFWFSWNKNDPSSGKGIYAGIDLQLLSYVCKNHEILSGMNKLTHKIYHRYWRWTWILKGICIKNISGANIQGYSDPNLDQSASNNGEQSYYYSVSWHA